MNVHEIFMALSQASAEADMGKAVFAEARCPQAWETARTSAHMATLVAQLRQGTERFLQEPIPVLPFSKYKLYEITGDRSLHETLYFNRRGRLAHFSVMALMEPSEEIITALEDTIWAICDEYSWCLPAHQGGTLLTHIGEANMKRNLENGFTGRSLREHEEIVDLFAAETGFALAESLSLLEDKLHPLVVKRAREEVLKRIIQPYMDINQPFHWEMGTGNWTSVCAGSVGSAAIYLVKDDGALSSILRKVADSMDRYLLGFTNDGACTEGVGYWYYGFSFYICFSELFRQRTGGRIDLLTGDRLREISLFIQRLCITGNLFPTFSDSWAQSDYYIGLFAKLREHFPEVRIPDAQYRANTESDHCYRFCKFIREFIWDKGETSPDEAVCEDSFFHDAQWVVTRTPQSAGKTAMAVKGGHNAEPHNQNDVGHFMLLSNGEMLFPDLGAGLYTRQYFSKERYGFFNAGSQGHSVPIVNGQCQKHGREFGTRGYSAEAKDGTTVISMDIARAYGDAGIDKLQRDISFNKQTAVFTLRDETAAAAPFEIIERIIAASVRQPEVSGDTVTVYGKETKATVAFDAARFACAVTRAPEDTVFGFDGYDVYTLDFTPKAADKTVVFEATIRL